MRDPGFRFNRVEAREPSGFTFKILFSKQLTQVRGEGIVRIQGWS